MGRVTTAHNNSARWPCLTLPQNYPSAWYYLFQRYLHTCDRASATSVAASVWTLVALSIERYYAICHPLRSRKWQTVSHARRLIAYIWTGGAVAMSPILCLSELQPTKKGHSKCRENWPNGDYERAYNLFLDVLLLVVPLLALAATYYLIATTLWQDLKANDTSSFSKARQSSTQDESLIKYRSRSLRSHESEVFVAGSDLDESSIMRGVPEDGYEYSWLGRDIGARSLGCCKRKQRVSSEAEKVVAHRVHKERVMRMGLRQTNYERSLIYKQRVIKMLFVVVLEFFICWTPLYVINTLALFLPQVVYGTVGYKTISFCHLLAYTSGCCNPITYCFMNKNFRTGFINMFKCQKSK